MSESNKPISAAYTNTASFTFTNEAPVTISTGYPATFASNQEQSVVVTTTAAAGSGTVVFTGSSTVSNANNSVCGTIPYSLSNPNEPSVGQTGVSVYQVAALLANGNSTAAVRHEFPSLSRREMGAAWDYAKQHPNREAVASYPIGTLKGFVLKTGFDKLK
jgi:uncharacterized protein (DUF433 family)